MSLEHWGDTRSKEGINRRVCLTRVPPSLRIEDIVKKYGFQNLEGVSIVRKRRLCFIQFKRPYDCSQLLDQGYLCFDGCQMLVRAFRETTPPPKRSSDTKPDPHCRYTKQPTPPPKEETKKASTANLSEWGTPIIEPTKDKQNLSKTSSEALHTHSQSYNYSESLSRSASMSSIRAEKRKRDESEDNEGGSEKSTSLSLRLGDWQNKSLSNHLKIGQFSVGGHSFGQANLSLQSTLPSSIVSQQHPHSSLPKFDEQKLTYTNAEKRAIPNLFHSAATTISNSISSAHYAAIQSNSDNDEAAHTLSDQIEWLLKLVITERTARNLSKKQIGMIREYFRKEEEAIDTMNSLHEKEKIELLNKNENPSQSITSSNMTKNGEVILDERAKRILDELEALQSK